MKSISEIREEFRNLNPEQIEEKIEHFRTDERKGVQKLLETERKKLARYKEELERIENLCYFEKKYESRGLICGVDEVGRGPLAGPVVAGAVILPRGSRILYINDSKKLSPARREALFDELREKAASYGIGLADAA